MWIRLVAKRWLRLEVNGSDTIGNVKAIVSDLEGIPAVQQLMVDSLGVHMHDHFKLQDYNVRDGDAFLVRIRLHQLFVHINANETIEIFVDATDTIENIKLQIFYKLHEFEPRRFELHMGYVLLADDRTFASYSMPTDLQLVTR